MVVTNDNKKQQLNMQKISPEIFTQKSPPPEGSEQMSRSHYSGIVSIIHSNIPVAKTI